MPTLTDMAWGSLNSLLNDPTTHQGLMDKLGQGNLTVEDLNTVFPTIQNWTGSGRQSAGQTPVESLWFDSSGNALIRDSMTGGYITSDQVSNSFSQDGGTPWYNPFRNYDDPTEYFDEDNAGKNWNPQTKQWEYDTTDDYYSWGELSPDIQNRITSQGLFPNLTEDFASTSNANHAQDWGLNDIGTIDQSNINSVMQNLIGRQSYLAGNTAQNESEGWLLGDGLPTLLQTVGSVLGGPAGGFLNLAGNLTNTGQALGSGNYGSALMGGIGSYNQAGLLANAATGTNTHSQVNPQSLVEDYLLPDMGSVTPYISSGIVGGGVSALNGDDFGTGFTSGLVGQASRDIAGALGIPAASGIVSQGLQSLFTQNGQQIPSNAGVGGGGGTSSGNTGGSSGTGGQTPTGNVIQTDPYQVFNPSTPTYTNPFSGVPNPYVSNSYGDIPYNEDLDATDLSDTNNPYNTPLNYNGSGQNVYG